MGGWVWVGGWVGGWCDVCGCVCVGGCAYIYSGFTQQVGGPLLQVGEALSRQLAGLLQTLEQCLCGGFTGTGGVPALKV